MSGRDRWICLVYHEVPPAVLTGPDAHFAIPATEFAGQLDWLLSNGYAVASLEQANRMGSRRVVAVTFDDGHETHHAAAYPLLAERGLSATFFVVTDLVGTEGHVTWDQLREMKKAGMSIQSHTVTHPFLSTLTADEVRSELRESRARLDAELGQTTTSLALPGGDFPTRSARRAIAEAGYRLVATSRVAANQPDQGRGSDVRFIARVTVRQGQSRSRFERVIAQDRGTLGREFVRASVLNTARSVLGRHRYARWRRVLLDAVR